MVNQTDVARYLENWQDEIESAFLYRALAKTESQPALAEVYRRLAITEDYGLGGRIDILKQALRWLNNKQKLPHRNHLPWGTENFDNRTSNGCSDRNFHFHGFQHCQAIAH